VTPFQLAGLALEGARMDDGRLRLTTPEWQADVPLSLTWSRQPEPKLLAKSSGLSLTVGGINLKAEEGSAEATLKTNDKKWQGSWHVKNISVTGMEPPPPVLQGDGGLSVEGDNAVVEGKISSPDQAWKLVFEERFWPGAPEKSHVRIVEAAMPWKDGILSTREVVVPLIPGPLALTLNVKRVSAEALMQQITGKSAAASGALSGFLPVTIGADGALTVHNGKLEADEPGLISLPPDAIPGDNEQVAMLRDALGNFHYTTLTVDMDSGKDGRMVLHMLLEGSNPGVQDGRPFKVNVNLRGDVLNLVRQNIMLLINPLQLQELSNHAQ
jgi:hypothetical protein